MPATERCPGQPETGWEIFHSACLLSSSVMDAPPQLRRLEKSTRYNSHASGNHRGGN